MFSFHEKLCKLTGLWWIFWWEKGKPPFVQLMHTVMKEMILNDVNWMLIMEGFEKSCKYTD